MIPKWAISFSIMKVGLAQLNLEIGAFAQNLSRMEEMVAKARDRSCSLILFPELSICGYPPKDLLCREDFVREAMDAARDFASKVKGITAIFGGIEAEDNPRAVYNAAFVAREGGVVATYRKMLLPAYDIFDEPRYFKAGDQACIFETDGFRIGITVCEDIWNGERLSASYPRDPVEELQSGQLSLLVNLSASPYEMGKARRRLEWLGRTAQKLDHPVAYCNGVGGHDAVVFDGGSMVLNGAGEVLALGPYFQESLVVADLAATPIQEVDTPQEIVLLKDAIVCGLKDYLRRTGFERVLLGLSGGIDSSVCAVLASMAVGPENVLGVLMPSPYTSKESVEDALELARRLGIETVTVPISPVMEVFIEQLAPCFKGYEPDVTEENLQARIRGTILMSLSNKYRSMLLATGNKSELAVGYCTLYGDMAGGYAPIADLLKTRVYELAHHLNELGDFIPARVLEKAPTAELREGQRDEDDLPPYPLLDKIIHGYVEEGRSLEELTADGVDRGIARDIINRLHRNEYKRRQAPPGPRVSRAAFADGRRFPVCHVFR